jgi:hypothetical protein
MLLVCSEKNIRGFTYGRIYFYMDESDLYIGRFWIKNDQGFTVAENKSSFKKLTDWKKQINKSK